MPLNHGNMPMSMISSPPTMIPAWNADEEYVTLQSAFGFAKKHLQDNDCVIVFHSWCVNSKSNVVGLCDTYSMVKIKELMSGNHIHLISAVDNTMTISSLQIFK